VEAAEVSRLLKLISEARERLMMDQPWAADAKLQEAASMLTARRVSGSRERLVSRGFSRGRG